MALSHRPCPVNRFVQFLSEMACKFHELRFFIRLENSCPVFVCHYLKDFLSSDEMPSTNISRNTKNSKFNCLLFPQLMDPHPSVVASKLLARKEFIDNGKQFNMIACSWIQFMIHDWVDHMEETEQVLNKREPSKPLYDPRHN